ncbi:RING-box protein 2 isoform X2 [Pipra filicauda]|uniref:RING-box protein 2 isoform X2 n=2 Tax=Pipridae TaxID=114313 RepID=A0A6J2I582_9PASS|nr:RING-box protein 2 isoform X2 [Pipra filicauda]
MTQHHHVNQTTECHVQPFLKHLQGRWLRAAFPAPAGGWRCRPARPPRPRPSAMADVEDGDEPGAPHSLPGSAGSKAGGPDKMFSLKKWNAVAMWSWDVECDTCAICRVQMPVLDVKLKTNKKIVLWFGENAIIPSTTAACPCG